MEASPRIHSASMICSSSFVSFGKVIYRGILLCSSVNLLQTFVLSIEKCGHANKYSCRRPKRGGYGKNVREPASARSSPPALACRKAGYAPSPVCVCRKPPCPREKKKFLRH